MSQPGTDLEIFNGMEGFENLNSTDDSSLVALLDDLQDETLMTLLNDGLFVKELCDSPFQSVGQDSMYSHQENWFPSDVPVHDSSHVRSISSSTEETVLPARVSNILDGNKRERVDSSQEKVCKRLKLDSPNEEPKAQDRGTVLANVMHDHCYTSSCEDCVSLYQSSFHSDEETSNEEGSGSDTGICSNNLWT